MARPDQFRSSIQTRLPLNPVGITDPELKLQMDIVYETLRKILTGIDLLPCGYGIYDLTVTYGQIVNVFDNSGSHVRLASAAVATPRAALAFASNLDGTLINKADQFQCAGIIRNLTGLTPGAIYYLSATTPGAMSTAAPIGTGKLVQQVGFAIDTTNFYFNPSLDWTVLP